MFDHIRKRLTMGYVGILALILLVFGVVVVFSFYLRASEQQDDLLLQKAEDIANNVLGGKGKDAVVKATTRYDVAAILLLPDGSTYGDLNVTFFSLGLPYSEAARRAAKGGQTVSRDRPRTGRPCACNDHPRQETRGMGKRGRDRPGGPVASGGV